MLLSSIYNFGRQWFCQEMRQAEFNATDAKCNTTVKMRWQNCMLLLVDYWFLLVSNSVLLIPCQTSCDENYYSSCAAAVLAHVPLRLNLWLKQLCKGNIPQTRKGEWEKEMKKVLSAHCTQESIMFVLKLRSSSKLISN